MPIQIGKRGRNAARIIRRIVAMHAYQSAPAIAKELGISKAQVMWKLGLVASYPAKIAELRAAIEDMEEVYALYRKALRHRSDNPVRQIIHYDRHEGI